MAPMTLLKRTVTVFVVIVAVIVGVLFALRNAETIRVDFLAFSAGGSIAAWLVGAFVVGGLLGLSLNVTLFIRMKRTERRALRERRQHGREMDGLRGSATDS